MKLPNHAHAVIDIEKLRDYCLNPSHRRGQHKARVFASALGLSRDDAEELRIAIYGAAQVEEAVPMSSDRYGQRYFVDFDLRRISGHQARIRTLWIVRQDEDFPGLTSCYVL